MTARRLPDLDQPSSYAMGLLEDIDDDRAYTPAWLLVLAAFVLGIALGLFGLVVMWS